MSLELTGTGSSRASERRLRELLDGIDAIVVWLDEAGRVRYNARLRTILGRDPDSLPTDRHWERLVHPDDRPATDAVWLSAATSWELEYRMRHADGRWIWVRDRGRREKDADGRLTAIFCVVTDITEIREAAAGREAALREREALYRRVIEGPFAIFHERDHPGGTPRYMSPQFEALTGHPVERWMREPGFWRSLVHPEDRERVYAAYESGSDYRLEYRIVHASGRVIWLRDHTTVAPASEGRPAREIGVGIDITSEREATAEREAAILARERLYRELIERQDAVTWVNESRDGSNRYISPQVEAILGYPPERWSEPGFWQTTVHPDDLAEVLRAAMDERDRADLEYRAVAADGRVVRFRERIRTIVEPDGRRLRYGLTLDVTRLREAEEELATLERRTAELARLEALARVAATTAHDFGNILVGIDVFRRFLAKNPTLDDAALRDVAQIGAAVEAGRAATAALVSLGNLGASPIVSTDVHDLVRGLSPSLLGLLGPGVALTLRLDAASPVVEVDPGAFERAIVNLAVNARDALADGGSVTIATSEVEEDESTPTAAGLALAGRYLSVEVADDGCGMSAETLARAFEPYYTTKPIGKGTGLGLSSVHAAATAVDGHVHAASAPGRGTTVRVCLPLD